MSSSTSTGSSIIDPEFGRVSYRRVAHSRHVRIRLASDGTLRASLPVFAPVKSIERLIDSSRDELRQLVGTRQETIYTDGQRIGHSHTLRLTANRNQSLKHVVRGQVIHVSYPADIAPDLAIVQETIREGVTQALRIESKAYLPRRLAFLASEGGFSYARVRFAHQSGRWGSCSSNGTISLNIALMALPFELIDYVLIHELAHTEQMNHSPAFWQTVERHYPHYRQARKTLTSHSPYL